MEKSKIYELFDNLIEGDIHTTIDFIIKKDKSWTHEELLEMYDNR